MECAVVADQQRHCSDERSSSESFVTVLCVTDFGRVCSSAVRRRTRDANAHTRELELFEELELWASTRRARRGRGTRTLRAARRSQCLQVGLADPRRRRAADAEEREHWCRLPPEQL